MKEGYMPLYAQVIIDITHANVDRVFTYQIPDDLSVSVGQRVVVPFGRSNAPQDGYVISVKDEYTENIPLKTIIKKAEGFAVLRPDQIQLATWMRQKYHCLMADALRLMLPSQARKGKVRAKTIGVAKLVDPLTADSTIDTLKGKKGGRSAPIQAEVVSLLKQAGRIAVTDLYEFLPGARSALAALKHKGITVVEDTPVRRVPYNALRGSDTKQRKLSKYQQAALDSIERKAAEGGGSLLLHGVTGSGKTEVYLRAAEKCLQSNRGVIILVPEISLTPQMVARFRERLGETVAVLHSRLSAGERYDEWMRIRNGEAVVVIGPRSALFAPVQNIGLIVIDEEHEQSYRSEHSPHYYAHEVAEYRAFQSNAVLVLGSATPSILTYHRCSTGELECNELPERFGVYGLPRITISDMRDELQKGNRTIFSGVLYKALEETLARGEQAILFINRRGYSTFMMCRGCGYVFRCPDCDVSMTYHRTKRNDWLQCHYCGRREDVPSVCPECGKPYLKHFGTGTQQVEEQVNACFPQARTLRMDHDTTQGKDAHLKILEAFGNKEADILIGTQMIAKGLDFENVTLVGVMAADSMLHIPDYRSAERTFQLIMQVAGRAGRAQLPGNVIIQSYNPDHFAIQTAAAQNYGLFYRQEIQYRKIAQYPPFTAFVQLLFTGEEETCKQAIRDAESIISAYLKHNGVTPLEFTVGPAPISRIKEQTRLRILIKLVCNADWEKNVSGLYDLFFEKRYEGCIMNMETNPINML